MVKDWLEEEGLATEYLDDEDTDVNCFVVKDDIMLNIGFLKTAKDGLIVSGKEGIQAYPQDEVLESTKLGRDSLYDIELVFLQMNLDFTIDDTNSSGRSSQYRTCRFTKQCFFTVCQKTDFLTQWYRYSTA